MAKEARDYQNDMDAEIRSAFRNGHKRVLVCSPTGTGKTFVATRLLKGCEVKGNHSMFMAPRRELVMQSANALIGFGVVPGIIMAGEPMNMHRKTQVASFDTLHSRVVKRKKMPLPPCNLLAVDEAHLTLAETRKELIAEYKGAFVVGFTATPAGPNGRPMKEVYDHLIVGPPIRWFIDEGWLVEMRYFAPTAPDLKKVKLNKDGDYQEKALSRVMNTSALVGDVVENWMAHARGTSTVVFCVDRAHARHVTEQFVGNGIAAEYVDGETPTEQRKAIFKRVDNGTTRVLVNVFVASYGLDIPRLQTIVMARPTKSLVLYLQMAGRVLRPTFKEGMPISTQEERLAAIAASDKPFACMLDHSGCVIRLGYIDDYIPWTLEGDEDILDAKERIASEKKDPKQMTCPRCKMVFKGTRFCPGCGFELVPPGEPVPTFAALLAEVKPTDGKEANRKTSWDDKVKFFGEAKAYGASKGWRDGFAANLYREKFGVWPNDPRVSSATPITPTDYVKGFIKHRAIRKIYQRK